MASNPPEEVVVELESSGDEDASAASATEPAAKQPQPQSLRSSAVTTPSVSEDRQKQDSEYRSFWKAGNYAVGDTFKPVSSQDLLEHARVHPKFLHSNATSHKWAFGAIAELLDNAVDEIQNGATFVKVDKIDVMKDNNPALLFLDDGGGMDPESLRKCMSLGYSSKKNNTTIGQYGNGFKTSTMRLGADVIVFSRAVRGSQSTQSVGLLSYTYLRKTGQDDVIVPMIDFDTTSNWVEPIVYGSHDDWSSNLKTILEWSPFTTKEELMLQFDDIGTHGTKVIIFNLWLNDEGIYELNFDDDEEDIRLRDEATLGSSIRANKKLLELQSHISYRIRYSLRAYASILYLKKFVNFKIILRGKPVEQFNIADELRYPMNVPYKPQISSMKEITVTTTLGFIKEAPDLNVSGFNVYHKNRLIRPFWKVCAEGSSKGNGVVGVLEANFIEPAHDKQDFERSPLFVRLESRLKQMVHEYWKERCHFVGYQPIGIRKVQKDRPVHNRKKSDYERDTTSATIPEDLSDDDELPENYQRSNSRTDLPDGSCELVNLGDPEDSTELTSVDQLCEENIQLFMRCEEHARKQTDLKKTVVGLENQLEHAKRKCAQIAAYIESKKKQQSVGATRQT